MESNRRFLVVVVEEGSGVARTFQVISKLDSERPGVMRGKLARAFEITVEQFLRDLAGGKSQFSQ